MKVKDFSTAVEKYGYIVGDVEDVPAGVSKKTGNAFDRFAYFTLLPYGARKAEDISIDLAYVDELSAVTSSLDWNSGIVVRGNADATGRFVANEIEAYDFK